MFASVFESLTRFCIQYLLPPTPTAERHIVKRWDADQAAIFDELGVRTCCIRQELLTQIFYWVPTQFYPLMGRSRIISAVEHSVVYLGTITRWLTNTTLVVSSTCTAMNNPCNMNMATDQRCPDTHLAGVKFGICGQYKSFQYMYICKNCYIKPL